MHGINSFFLTLIGFGLGFLPFFSLAQPEIHFTEYKILLNDSKTTSEYRILNQGNSAASCTTKFIDFMISDGGQLTPPKVDEKPSNSAAFMLRGSPSRVVIPANGAQKVKVIVRGLRGNPDGEWHSYLNIRCQDEEVDLQNGVNLLPNFVFNIPVTVRKGELTVKVDISDVKLLTNNNHQWLDLNLNRSGSRSLYGDFTVEDETGAPIGKLNGVSHYLQSTKVPVKINLTQAPQGKVHVTFKENSRFGGNEHADYWLD